MALGLPILGNHLRNRHRLLRGHGGFHLDTHITASCREISCGHIVRTAKHQLDITVADDLRPQVVGIPILKLAQTLNCDHDPDITGSDDAEGSGKVRTVRCTADTANIFYVKQSKGVRKLCIS